MPPSKPCLRMKHHQETSNTKRNVAFQNIEIAEYPVQVGDNPVAVGVPISLGWKCSQKQIYDFEEYENCKDMPRTRFELLIPADMRRDILARQGFTASEMRMAVLDAKKIKKSRNRSIKNQKWDRLHLFMEKGQRTLKKVTSLTLLSSALDDGPTFSKSISSPSLYPTLNDEPSDPLDITQQGRLALHLLHHPEELEEIDDEEEELEEEMKNRKSSDDTFLTTSSAVDMEEPICF